MERLPQFPVAAAHEIIGVSQTARLEINEKSLAEYTALLEKIKRNGTVTG
ncbi:MAG: hypothetical protein J1F03_00120 [Oscillospiraceae bacterium]|nr:hypothetical protein [Oscillospiraceae bacterium]